MRRYLYMAIGTISLAASLPAVTSAQAAPDLCTAKVYVEPDLGLSADHPDLLQATNLLSEHGIDARILILRDLDGASDVVQYEQNTLAKLCPELVRITGTGLSRPDDLFIAILVPPMRVKGAVYGDRMESVHSEELFSESANSHLGDATDTGNDQLFATGLLEYFKALDGKLDPFNWRLAFVGGGIALLLFIVVAVVIVSIRKRQNRKLNEDMWDSRYYPASRPVHRTMITASRDIAAETPTARRILQANVINRGAGSGSNVRKPAPSRGTPSRSPNRGSSSAGFPITTSWHDTSGGGWSSGHSSGSDYGSGSSSSGGSDSGGGSSSSDF